MDQFGRNFGALRRILLRALGEESESFLCRFGLIIYSLMSIKTLLWPVFSLESDWQVGSIVLRLKNQTDFTFIFNASHGVV